MTDEIKDLEFGLSEGFSFNDIPVPDLPKEDSTDDDGPGEEQDVPEEVEEEASGDAEDSSEEEGEEGEEPEEAKPSKEVVKQVFERKKPFVFKVGGEQVRLSPKALLTVTVAGENREISLTDLTDSYSSAQVREQKWQEVQAEKKSFEKEKVQLLGKVEQEKAQLQTFLKNVNDQLKANNPFGALALIGTVAGEEPLQFVRQFRGKLIDAVREYLDLDDRERKILEAEEEKTYYSNQLKQRDARYQQEQEYNKTVQEIDVAVKTYDLGDREDFARELQEVQAKIQSGQLKTEERLTADFVGRYVQAKRYIAWVSDAVQELAPQGSFSQDEIARAAVLASHDKLSQTQVKERLAEHFGVRTQKAVSQLSEKARDAGLKAPKNVPSKQKKLSDSDLEWLMRG